MTILIDNFSIGVEDWVEAANLTYSVDVIETASGVQISTSGTYFIDDGTIAPTTFSGITDGYTCYYTPSGVLASGTITLTIHAENTASGVEEQNFHLLYGYNCFFNEIVDWGPKNEVVITIEAKNEAFCPNLEGEAFYFETEDYTSYDLGASIVPIGSVDLGATIRPQNTFFFYGRTYTITVSGVKDYHGNEMDPYIFNFTIEDPTT
jgi:hypothetical protein